MAATEWKRVEGYKGLMVKEHPTRRHGPHPDKCYGYRMQVDGKRRFEILGWASATGWTPKKAMVEMERLREAAKTGSGPASRAEMKALAEAEKQARAEAEATRVAEEERDNLTFGRFYEETYLPQQVADNKSAGALRAEKGLFKNWLTPSLAQKPLKDIAPIHLEAIKKKMTDAGRSARSIEYALALVRQVFNLARQRDRYDGLSPTSKVKKPSEDNQRLRFLTHDEADLLIAALDERSQDVHDMALLSLHCGLRAGEIFRLEWGDIDLERGVITIRGTSRRVGTQTKSGKSRPAIMTDAVRSMVESRPRGGHHNLVFPGREGKRIVQASDTFPRVVEALGLNEGIVDDRQRVVFHTLRHTFASRLVEQGVDLFTVKELMGHSTTKMTERYSHLDESKLIAAVRTMEAGMTPDQNRDRKSESGKVTAIR